MSYVPVQYFEAQSVKIARDEAFNKSLRGRMWKPVKAMFMFSVYASAILMFVQLVQITWTWATGGGFVNRGFQWWDFWLYWMMYRAFTAVPGTDPMKDRDDTLDYNLHATWFSPVIPDGGESAYVYEQLCVVELPHLFIVPAARAEHYQSIVARISRGEGLTPKALEKLHASNVTSACAVPHKTIERMGRDGAVQQIEVSKFFDQDPGPVVLLVRHEKEDCVETPM